MIERLTQLLIRVNIANYNYLCNQSSIYTTPPVGRVGTIEVTIFKIIALFWLKIKPLDSENNDVSCLYKYIFIFERFIKKS